MFHISRKIEEKLKEKHNITPTDVRQCFANWNGNALVDDNEDHKTDPPSCWFIGETNKGLLLKVIYVDDGATFFLKSAFPANEKNIKIFRSNYPLSE